MEVTIRRAKENDIDTVLELLQEVLEVHARIRPDIFISGTTKYTGDDLKKMFQNEDTPVLVAVNEDDVVQGYAFCVIQKQPFTTTMKNFTTLYLDDLCVDEKCRGQHVGTKLYQAVLAYAKQRGCYDVTLNVWEGNDNARSFYESMGMRIKETTMETIL